MSAPASDLFSSSVSSSGHVDGLGRRSLSFDRETGAMLEGLHVRPELAVFEQIIRKRIEHLAQLEQPHFARPVRSERDPSTGDLVILAEFVSGSRLSDLLDVAADTAVVPGVDVALGFLLQVLPALTVLHTQKRAVHGLIDPTRTVLTSDGRVVMVDLALGSAVELLHLSPQRLWNDLGVCTANPAGPVVFDPVTDVTQAALVALMLVLGRNLHDGEYPDRLPALVAEVIEVAHIRGTSSFGSGLQRILQRSLPLPGRHPYRSADEALSDVNQLVRQEIGVDVCKRAIVDFVAQMDAAISASLEADAADPIEEVAEEPSETEAPELDRFLDQVDQPEPRAAAPIDETSLPDLAHGESEDEGDMEISLEQLEPAAAAQPQAEEVYDLPTLEDLAIADPAALTSELAALDTIAVAPQHSRRSEPSIAPLDPIAALSDLEPPAPPAPASVAQRVPAAVPVVDDFEAALTHLAAAEAATAPAIAPEPAPALVAGLAEPAVASTAQVEVQAAPEPAVADAFDAFAPPAATPSAPAADAAASDSETESGEGGSSRRRKRQQQKSARARKDKLRSTTSDHKPAPPPPPPAPPARPSSPSGWLVSPSRSTEPPIPDPLPPPPPPRPMMPSFAPTMVGQVPQPAYTSLTPQVSPYGTPTRPQPPPQPVQPPSPPPAPAIVKPEPLGTVGVKPDVQLKPVVAVKKDDLSLPAYSGVDRFSTLSLGRTTEDDRPREFPWRLAAVAVSVAVVAIIVGRSYLPGRTAVAGEPGAEDVTPPSATAPVAQATAPKSDSPIPAGKGRISIETQPAGIKVLLDRKPIGETPLLVDAAPGRRVLTFLTSGGEVMHSVRVIAGKTVPMDVPVFSGWVSIAAPLIMDIAEGGRSLGTTEQPRLMLPPGRHQLTLSNKDLGYSAVHTVDIEPGGVRSLSISPKGTANLNAAPWAEVWLDGAKLGDTPLANTQVPLGLREFVFKHPELGERRVPATIRANATATITVDFAK